MALPDTYSIGEAAAILRISPPTLRVWERRYHVLEPGRTHSNHRRYTIDDLQLLARLKLAAIGAGGSVKRAATNEKLSREGREPMPPGEGQSADVAAVDQPVWRFIADQLGDLILILDEHGHTVDANLATAQAVGIERRRLLNRPFSTLVDDPDRALAAEIAATPPLARRSWLVRMKAAGSVIVICFDCRPVRYEGARLLMLIGRFWCSSVEGRESTRSPEPRGYGSTPPAPDGPMERPRAAGEA